MSLDLEQLQHEILEAESYLQSNVSISTDLRERDASRRSIGYNSSDGITEPRKKNTTVPISTIGGPSGRYSDPVEREQLIQRLLRERDQTRQRATVSMENNETFHDNNASSNVPEVDHTSSNLYFTTSSPPSSTFAISPEKSGSGDRSRGSDSNNFDQSPSSPMIFYASDVLSGNDSRSNMDFGHEIYGKLEDEDATLAETVRFTRPVEPWIDRSYSPPTSMATLPDLERQSTHYSEGSDRNSDIDVAQLQSTSHNDRSLQNKRSAISSNNPTTTSNRSSSSYFNDIISGYGIPASKSSDSDNRKNDAGNKSVVVKVGSSKYLKSREDLIREADELFKATHSFKPALSANTPSATGRPSSAPRSRLYLLSTKSSSAQRSSSRSLSASRAMKSQQASDRRQPSRSRSASRSRSFQGGNQESTFSNDNHGEYDTTASLGMMQSGEFTLRGRSDDDSLVRQSTTSNKNTMGSASPQHHRQQQPKGPASTRASSPYSSTSQRRIEEMHRLYEQKLRDRERQRLDLQRLELSECTFTPNISRSSTETILRHRSELNGSSSQSRRESESPRPIAASARLYKEAEERNSQQKWLEKKVTEARMAQYTFQPTIKKVSAAADELQRERRKRLEQLRESYEREMIDQLPFRPQMLTKKSHKSSVEDPESAELSVLYNDVGSRLNEAGRIISRRKQQLLVDKERDLLEAMEPAPVSKGTEKIAKNSEIVSAKFSDRQELLAEKAKFRENQRNQLELDKEESWFKPEIDTKSISIIEKKRPELLSETATERAERMSRQEAQRLEERREKKAAEIYGNISFAPQIDALSKVLGKATGSSEYYHHFSSLCVNATYHYDENLLVDLEELSENNRGKHSREILRQKAELEESKECSPKINDLSKLLANNVSSPIHTPDSAGGVQANKMFSKGLGRYLELKQMSSRQKEELKQRELDAFSVRNVDKFRRVEDGTTIVESFRFRTARRAQQQATAQ
eukprot:gene33839-43723_t